MAADDIIPTLRLIGTRALSPAAVGRLVDGGRQHYPNFVSHWDDFVSHWDPSSEPWLICDG